MSGGRKNTGYALTRNDRCPSGEIIENARIEKDLSLVQAAKLAKVSAGTIDNIERFGVATTKVCTLLAICKALDLDIMELIKADVGQIL